MQAASFGKRVGDAYQAAMLRRTGDSAQNSQNPSTSNSDSKIDESAPVTPPSAPKDESQQEIPTQPPEKDTLCFPAETLVSVIDQSTRGYHSARIDSVQVGDFVVSCRFDVSENLFCEPKKVLNVITRRATELIKLSIQGKVLRATENHPFYLPELKEWKEAKALVKGDLLLSIDGSFVSIDDVEAETADYLVYNLEIADYHNYYACDVLVHNCDVAVAGTVAVAVEGALEGEQLGALWVPLLGRLLLQAMLFTKLLNQEK